MDEKELLIKMNFEREALSREIRMKIIDKKLTQCKICEDLGFYPQNLCAFLNGRSKLSLKKVKKVCDYLGI